MRVTYCKNSKEDHWGAVIEGEKGLFIAMPSKKTPNNEYRDVAHPINGEMRNLLQEAILERFKKALDELPDED